MINAKKLPGVNSALQLSGASVCVQTGTTTELNLADYFKANNLEYSPVVFEKLEEVNAAYDAGAATSTRPTSPASMASAWR